MLVNSQFKSPRRGRDRLLDRYFGRHGHMAHLSMTTTGNRGSKRLAIDSQQTKCHRTSGICPFDIHWDFIMSEDFNAAVRTFGQPESSAGGTSSHLASAEALETRAARGSDDWCRAHFLIEIRLDRAVRLNYRTCERPPHRPAARAAVQAAAPCAHPPQLRPAS